MSGSKIAAAQIASVRGDIEQNIATHAAAIALAARHDVSVLTFPELSLIGYEPDLAEASAIEPTAGRLAPLQDLARQSRIDVVVGAALRNGTTKPSLGAIHGALQAQARGTERCLVVATSRQGSWRGEVVGL